LQAILNTADRKCEFCGKPLYLTPVDFGGRVENVPSYGSCGCRRSKEKLDGFGPSGRAYLNTSHRCPICGGNMQLDAYSGRVSDCPWCGYSCVFSGDLGDYNDGIRLSHRAKGNILEGTGVPELFWSVEPDGERADAIESTGKGFYIVGGNGTAKTLMAAAIAKALAERGWNVRFAATTKMLSQFKDTYGSMKSELDVLDELCGCDLLVIDDLGKENPTSWASSMLYTVIDGRYGAKRPIVVTTNFHEDELIGRIARSSDESTAKAMVSRLHEMTDVVHMDGPDRRLS